MHTIATNIPLHLRSTGLYVAVHYETPGQKYRIQETEYVSERAADQVLRSLANLLALIQPTPVFRLAGDLVVVANAVAVRTGARVTATLSHGEHTAVVEFDCPDVETADALAVVFNTANDRVVAEQPFDIHLFRARRTADRLAWTRRPTYTAPTEEVTDHVDPAVADA